MQFNSRTKKLALLSVLILTVSFLTVPSSVHAQDVAVGNATATVLAVLTVTAGNDLTFGDVLQGVPKSASKSVDAEAGAFAITGAASKQIEVYMQLPDYLALADGSDRMVIAFSTTDGNYNAAAGAVASTAGATSMDPHNIPTLTLSAAGEMALFLGGSVYPTVDQTNGAYTGDVIVTVAYNGS